MYYACKTSNEDAVFKVTKYDVILVNPSVTDKARIKIESITLSLFNDYIKPVATPITEDDFKLVLSKVLIILDLAHKIN